MVHSHLSMLKPLCLQAPIWLSPWPWCTSVPKCVISIPAASTPCLSLPLQPFLRCIFILITCLCLLLCVALHTWVLVPTQTTGIWFPWSWSYRCLWAAVHKFQELSLGLVQGVLLMAEHLSSLSPFLFTMFPNNLFRRHFSGDEWIVSGLFKDVWTTCSPPEPC